MLAIISSWSDPASGQTPSDRGLGTLFSPRVNEADNPAPVDYGLGPGVTPARRPAVVPAAMPAGGSTAGSQGMFGAPVPWPIIAIHMVLLPDGRVMNYGTNQTGQQGAQFIYDVWNPTLGTGGNAHLVLPNTTNTDLFCSAQIVLPSSGQVLVTGGDLTINGRRNYSQNDIELFTPTSNKLTAIGQMQYPRWYPSLVMMPNGDALVLGGLSAPATPATVPEVYNPINGWRTLTGAADTLAFGSLGLHWYYPRGFLTTSGKVFLLGVDGIAYTITTAGGGTIVQSPARTTPGSLALPTVLYAPDRLLSLHPGASPEMINIRGKIPLFRPVPGISQNRFWSSATVMADGRILITGGSLADNQLQGVAYEAEIWNPGTRQWSVGASATKPRLYHSNALLLPDGSVVTAGGGAPGPVINLNAEIYYPSYLYKNDGSGQPATRPIFTVSQSTVSVGGTISGTVGSGQQISRITFVRTGSTTHSTNLDQRLFSLPFIQSGQQITATLPGGDTVLLPGYYMIFAFNNAGVPAIASIVLVKG